MKKELKPVTLESRWFELFGNNIEEIEHDVKRERWEEWKQLSIAKGNDELVEYWMTTDACDGCIHKDGDWCLSQQLPCTVNPVLTFQDGIKGMACMGVGKEEAEIAMK